jgi:hypothetical protein
MVLKAGSEEGALGLGKGLTFTSWCAGDATFLDVNIHTFVRAEEGELLLMDGHVGRRTCCEAEVVCKSMAWVVRRGFCWVNASGGGTGAAASATDCEPSEERFKKKGEEEGGEGVTL